ncbi:helix-turn-helix domain-containing protein [Streptomyces sp. NPDC017225]
MVPSDTTPSNLPRDEAHLGHLWSHADRPYAGVDHSVKEVGNPPCALWLGRYVGASGGDPRPLECRPTRPNETGARGVRIRRERLRHLRGMRGLTQSQLAAILECSRGAVSTWESTGRLPRPKRLQQLACVLGVPVLELIEEGDSSSLRSMRIGAGLLQQDVAHLLKVTKSTYCHVERGRQNVPSRWLPILSVTFGVSVDLLQSLESRDSAEQKGEGAE